MHKHMQKKKEKKKGRLRRKGQSLEPVWRDSLKKQKVGKHVL